MITENEEFLNNNDNIRNKETDNNIKRKGNDRSTEVSKITKKK